MFHSLHRWTVACSQGQTVELFFWCHDIAVYAGVSMSSWCIPCLESTLLACRLLGAQTAWAAPWRTMALSLLMCHRLQAQATNQCTLCSWWCLSMQCPLLQPVAIHLLVQLLSSSIGSCSILGVSYLCSHTFLSLHSKASLHNDDVYTRLCCVMRSSLMITGSPFAHQNHDDRTCCGMQCIDCMTGCHLSNLFALLQLSAALSRLQHSDQTTLGALAKPTAPTAASTAATSTTADSPAAAT